MLRAVYRRIDLIVAGFWVAIGSAQSAPHWRAAARCWTRCGVVGAPFAIQWLMVLPHELEHPLAAVARLSTDRIIGFGKPIHFRILWLRMDGQPDSLRWNDLATARLQTDCVKLGGCRVGQTVNALAALFAWSRFNDEPFRWSGRGRRFSFGPISWCSRRMRGVTTWSRKDADWSYGVHRFPVGPTAGSNEEWKN